MAKVGALRVTLGANTAQFEAGMRRAQASARQTGQNITRSMEGVRLRTAQSFAGIRFAATSLGVGLGAVAFVQYARDALHFAAGLGETSRQIGVTVEQLQILQRIAIANGASNETMERSLARFNRTLGEAKAGSESARRPFTALGFNQQQLNGWRQGGDALREVAERIMRIPDPARQAAAATALFGRAGQELLPTLQSIATEYDAVAAEAQRMGLLTEEQAAQADEAADKVDILAYSLKVRLAAAIADNVGPISEVASGLGNLAVEALNAADQLGRAADQAMVASQGFFRAVRLALLGANLINPLQFQQMEANAAGNARDANTRLNDAHLLSSRSIANITRLSRPARRAVGDPVDYQAGGGSGGRHHAGRSGADEAERRRKEALRDEYEFQSAMRRHQLDLLRVQQNIGDDYVNRFDVGRQIADLERTQYVAEQQLQVSLGELSQQRADQLIAAYDATAAEESRAQGLELDTNRAHERAELGNREYDLAADALRSQIDLADTAAERRRLELELLDLTYRHRRAKLEAVIAEEQAGRATHQAAVEARMELDQLDRERGAARAGAIRDTRGPMEEFLARLPQTADQANEALERVAAEGLQSITDGLADAILMTRSWGDVFKNIARQILSDLLRLQIERFITAPLARAMGGGGGGGGGILSALGLVAGAAQQMPGASVKIPGKAAGGPVIPGRTYVVGEKGPELLTMGRQHGFITPNGAGPSRVQVVPSPYFDLVVDGRVVRTGAPMVAAGMSSARTGAQADLHRRASRTIP